MKLTKNTLRQLVKEEIRRLHEEEIPPAAGAYDGAEPTWEMVVELDEIIPRLQKIREALHVSSGVFEGKEREKE